ncbi:hypothetical protein J2Y45_001832 [Dyadobacter sp. BE34]|uniref:Transposase DDE domain-containing protein n=1 Tax=Dyadobacter fermentans TaxID=94254 RepID=A0ABU1QV69_9BACT|nr:MULTISPECIES: hypothetical protein [Dyadobacter]MDR6804564.1 hypothetical protein [Dyadobacter fermentans]MDR7042304.1 hypothetical protein [Dyadobacter sp. BE242]MDR7196706.1 hypothetical protein [Dyadobacter sp. BE34]MDR7212749.1 hypothetical protein [Dyadobacter sp. BE31]MDR7262113.1 hypothetical protein [Dyadobacter sp. BE32]
MAGELRNSESRATFVSTKMQNDDQTVDPTDRPSMGLQFRLFLTLNANADIIYDMSSTQFYGYYALPVAKRRVVERSISWTNYFRRIVKDYEHTVTSSVNWLYLANIQIMIQRIPESC